MIASNRRFLGAAAVAAVALFGGCDVPADNEDAAELPAPPTTRADSVRAVEDVAVPDSARRPEVPTAGVADTGTSGRPAN